MKQIMRNVKQDPQLKDVLGEAIRPQPEWWLNGDPKINGQVCFATPAQLKMVYHILVTQINQIQGNIDLSIRIKGSRGTLCLERFTCLLKG